MAVKTYLQSQRSPPRRPCSRSLKKKYKMKVIRINNILFFKILTIAFEGESRGNLVYSTKYRNEDFSVQKIIVQSQSMHLKTNHFENYTITGIFEIFVTNYTSIIFGIIKVNGHTVIQVSDKEIKLPVGIYEIRTRNTNTIDIYTPLGYERWQVKEFILSEKGDKLTKSDECFEIYSTIDTCGSDLNATNIGHSDYYLYLYKDFVLLFYNHDCNGRGSNGLEFSCFFTFYNNNNHKNREVLLEVYEKAWGNYRCANDTMNIEVPIYPYPSVPDNVFERVESILLSMTRGMLSEEQIEAPKKIILLVKGLLEQLDYWDHPMNTYNDYADLLELIEEPLALNSVIKKYGFIDFMQIAKPKILEKTSKAILYQIKNIKKLLALKNQDGTFDISEIPFEIDNISDAILWSFGLSYEELDELKNDTVIIESELITPGKSVGNISLSDTIIKVYKQHRVHRVIEHGSYSLEYSYPVLGMAFFVKSGDPSKKIFRIKIFPPAKFITRKGIQLIQNTLNDVISAYGKPVYTTSQDSDLWNADYRGIQFSFQREMSLPKFPFNEQLHLNSKIIQISVRE
jgi:hypothetical protein